MYDRLFTPRGVAVFGSMAPGRLARVLAERLADGGYAPLCAVNPKGQGTHGVPGLRAIAEADFAVDLALIAAPAAAVEDIVPACGRAGVRAAAIITSGFGEAGDLPAEDRLRRAAAAHSMVYLGPNCAGLANPAAGLLATLEACAPPGPVAVLSQSGAVGGLLMRRIAARRLGVSKFASLGNGRGVTLEALLRYLAEDAQTQVIVLYLESVRDGAALLRAFEATTRVKPVVVIKAGRTAQGARAASSHTGALAGSDAVWDAALRAGGAIRAQSVDEAVSLCMGICCAPAPAGRRLLMLTNAGGPAVLATDTAESLDLCMPAAPQAAHDRLAQAVCANAVLCNPVDLTVQATPAQYAAALEQLLPAYDAALAIYVGTPYLRAMPYAEAIAGAATATRTPVYATLQIGEDIDEAQAWLADRLPVFPSAEDAVAVLSRLAEWNAPAPSAPAPAALQDALPLPYADGMVPEEDGMRLLAEHGIGVPSLRVVRHREGLQEACADIGYPVCMKLAADGVVHKSDIGGVRLNVLDDAEAVQAFGTLRALATPQAFRSVLVYPMVQSEGALEVILGAKRDATFGPVVLVGMGGIYGEVFRDTALLLAPFDEAQAEHALQSLRAWPLLHGTRGKPGVNLPALLETMCRFSRMVGRYAGIREIDINPLLVGSGAPIALDVRIRYENKKNFMQTIDLRPCRTFIINPE